MLSLLDRRRRDRARRRRRRLASGPRGARRPGHVWCRSTRRSPGSAPRPTAAARSPATARSSRGCFAERRPLYARLRRRSCPRADSSPARSGAAGSRRCARRRACRMLWARSARGAYPALRRRGGRWGCSRPPCPSGAASASPTRLCSTPMRICSPPLRGRASSSRRGGAQDARPRPSASCASSPAAGARRDDLVVALGGGVAGDLAGFVAATYQRGVPVVQVPTTRRRPGRLRLRRQDRRRPARGQELRRRLPPAAGGARRPRRCWRRFRRRRSRAGFVEVVKTALIAGGASGSGARLDFADLVRRRRELSDLVFACARTKIEVVAADERDAGRRAVLNLGHTVGHAIEAATGYGRYRHGEAVGLGLLAALRLSEADDLRDEVEGVARRHGLPTSLDGEVDVDAVLDAISLDKKSTAAGAWASSCSPGPAIPAGGRSSTRIGSASRRGGAPMTTRPNRVAVMHGANLDQLGRRDPEHLRRPHSRRARAPGADAGRASSGSSRSFPVEPRR